MEYSSSPHCVLTFVRFSNRSKSRLTENENGGTDTIKPMTVINDCISCTVGEAKEGYTSSFSAVLKGGDVNYLTSIHSGDYVLVNFADSSIQADDIRIRASQSLPINRYGFFGAGKDGKFVNDGFKGIFKIQSVRKRTSISDGVKQTFYQIVGFSHYFLTNRVYFIPQALAAGQQESRHLFFYTVNKKFQDYFANGPMEIQNTIRMILDAFLGTEIEANETNKQETTPNQLYHVPTDVCRLLGVGNKNRAIDFTNIILGKQTYSQSGNSSLIPAYRRLNPDLKGSPQQKTDQNQQETITLKSRVWETTGGLLEGQNFSIPPQFNNIAVGDYAKSFVNEVMNEMYVCNRVDPISNKVLPAIVVREKPFTSVNGPGATKFFTLPRWKIDADKILDLDVGVEEAARINFVQIYGQTMAPTGVASTSAQIALKNFTDDEEDIRAHGLRPYIVTSNFDFPPGSTDKGNQKLLTHTPKWVEINKDWLFGGHLKLNGSTTVFGIYDPIPPGDNAEIDGVVYHIESVNHSYNFSPEGFRSFRTQLNLSHGLRADEVGKNQALAYPEMQTQNPNPHPESSFKNSQNKDTRVGATQNGEEHNVLRGESVIQPQSSTRRFDKAKKNEGGE